MNVRKLVLDKIEELGSAAPEFFQYKQSTLDSWKKKPNSIPLKAVEKVLNEPQTGAQSLNQGGVKDAIAPAQGTLTSPPAPPIETEPSTPQPVVQPRPPYTIANAQDDIASIVQHFNAKLVPIIDQTKNQGEVNANAITQINEQLRELAQWKADMDRLVPSQQEHAQTVGQLLAAQPGDQFNQLANPNDLPSRLRPSNKAQVIAEYNPPAQSNGNNLDTGIAPSAEDRARSLGALADRQDPRHPAKPAGPAAPVNQNAPGMPNWSQPWPKK